MIVNKSAAELQHMEAANAIVLTILAELKEMARPGVSTLDLDHHAERRIREQESRPAFKGYRGYPFTLCASVNEQVVHAMPSKRKLKDGDIIGLDLGVIVRQGYYGDAAMTVGIGTITEGAQHLMDATRESLRLAIGRVKVGGRVSDIGEAVQSYVEARGYTVVREFVGHGIGRDLHEDPQVPNYVDRSRSNPRLKVGMVLAIEPMVNAGGAQVVMAKDGWTASTADGSLSAHFERSVAVTEDGPWILGERSAGITL